MQQCTDVRCMEAAQSVTSPGTQPHACHQLGCSRIHIVLQVSLMCRRVFKCFCRGSECLTIPLLNMGFHKYGALPMASVRIIGFVLALIVPGLVTSRASGGSSEMDLVREVTCRSSLFSAVVAISSTNDASPCVILTPVGS